MISLLFHFNFTLISPSFHLRYFTNPKCRFQQHSIETTTAQCWFDSTTLPPPWHSSPVAAGLHCYRSSRTLPPQRENCAIEVRELSHGNNCTVLLKNIKSHTILFSQKNSCILATFFKTLYLCTFSWLNPLFGNRPRINHPSYLLYSSLHQNHWKEWFLLSNAYGNDYAGIGWEY